MNGAQLRDGDLLLTEQFQQKGLKFLIGLVNFVYQEHHRLGGANGLEQRTLQQIVLTEQGAGQLLRNRQTELLPVTCFAK